MSEFMFVSTGNAEQDAAIASRIRLTNARLEDGVCPNGCALLVKTAPNVRECPACQFSQVSNVPFRE